MDALVIVACKSLVDKIKPDLVICVDALGSRRLERVNRTIQIGDTGISPGAGVGNHRMQINEKSLGVKVSADFYDDLYAYVDHQKARKELFGDK